MHSHAKELGFPTWRCSSTGKKVARWKKIWLIIWLAGWWFGTFGLFFPSYWECHHPNWRTASFFRGVGQPPTSWGYIQLINQKNRFVPMNSIEIPGVFHSFDTWHILKPGSNCHSDRPIFSPVARQAKRGVFGQPQRIRLWLRLLGLSVSGGAHGEPKQQKSSIQSLKIEGNLTPFDPYTVTIYNIYII